MAWYAASAVLLALATVVAAGTAMRWPRRGRDVLTAASTAAAVVFWSVFDVLHAGPVLVHAGGGWDVSVADLAGLPGLGLAGLLMGRTVLLARRQAAQPVASTEPPREPRA